VIFVRFSASVLALGLSRPVLPPTRGFDLGRRRIYHCGVDRARSRNQALVETGECCREFSGARKCVCIVSRAKKQRVHVADLRQEAAYKAGFAPLVALVDKGGARTILLVPMLKERTLVGAITLYRREVRPFTDKQIALVENFAAQAVIAIENARLLRELRERTDQLASQSEELAALNQQLEHRVADQVGEIERMGRLRRFLPPQVADLIVASGSEKQLESHRREITALFCDLRGFTGFTESADAEDVMALLRDYHAAVGQLVIKYSGTLERYAGDGGSWIRPENSKLDNRWGRLEVRSLQGRWARTFVGRSIVKKTLQVQSGLARH
jgi:GAF domain